MMIKLKHMTKTFGNLTVFDDVSFEFPSVGVVGLVGESGSGKSTLLHIILGLEPFSKGEVIVDNNSLSQMSKQDVSKMRFKYFGVAYQKDNLFSYDSLKGNLCLPLQLKEQKEQDKRAYKILKEMKLSHIKNKNVSNLSGGEKQRVSIGRAIIANPPILVLDEPTSALDKKSSQIIKEIIKKYSKDHLVIMSSHDSALINEIADSIVTIKHKKLVEISKSQKKNEKNMGNHKEGKFPLSFHLKSAIKRNFFKKWRFLILNFMIMLGFLTLGMSVVLNESIGATLNKEFSYLLDDSTYVLSSKNDIAPRPLNLSYEEACNLPFDVQKGIIYENNFQGMLKDKNSLSIVGNNERMELFHTGLDDINMFSFSLEYGELRDDEIVIQLGKKEFEEFNKKFPFNKAQLLLQVANNDWEYSDEQIFTIVKVEKGEGLKIIHSNNLFNEYVIETRMRFPTFENSIVDYPWRLNKKTYLRIDDYIGFMEIYKKEIEGLVLEKSAYFENVYYPYVALGDDKINYKLGAEIVRKYNLETFICGNAGIYSIYPSSFLSGFARDLFVSAKSETINDYLKEIEQLKDDVSFEVPANIGRGNVIAPSLENVFFSATKEELRPDEIIISSALSNKIFGKNVSKEKVTLTYLRKVTCSSQNCKKDYVSKEFVVSNVVSSDKYFISQSSFWLQYYFPYYFDISSQDQMTSAIALKGDEESIKQVIDDYSHYLIENPALELKKELIPTLDGVSKVFGGISIIVIIISIILIFIVMDLFYEEESNDRKIIYLLGGATKDIFLYHFCQSTFSILTSYICSNFFLYSLIAFENFKSRTIISFALNLKPFLAISLTAAIIISLICFRIFFSKKNYK